MKGFIYGRVSWNEFKTKSPVWSDCVSPETTTWSDLEVIIKVQILPVGC